MSDDTLQDDERRRVVKYPTRSFTIQVDLAPQYKEKDGNLFVCYLPIPVRVVEVKEGVWSNECDNAHSDVIHDLFMYEYLSKHLEEVIKQAVRRIEREMEIWADMTWVYNDLDTQRYHELSARAAKDLKGLLKTEYEATKARLELEVRRGQPPKVSSYSKEDSYRRYKALYSKAVKVKTHHDQEYKRYEEEHWQRGYSSERWRSVWLSHAKNLYPDESDTFLSLFANPDNYSASASDIAYLCLGEELGISKEYAKKVVQIAKREKLKGDEEDIINSE
jgi:hypothetical protein